MAWKDNLFEASIAGVTFFCPEAMTDGGIRNAIHEFPDRDGFAVETLGTQGKRYKLKAYTIGDNYMADRDALLRVLDFGGKAVLNHKYLGRVEVYPDTYSFVERTSQGGYCEFDLNFLQYFDFTSQGVDALGACNASLTILDDQAADDFANAIKKESGTRLTDIIRRATEMVRKINGYVGYMQLIRSDPKSALIALLPENIRSAIISEPKKFALAVFELARTIKYSTQDLVEGEENEFIFSGYGPTSKRVELAKPSPVFDYEQGNGDSLDMLVLAVNANANISLIAATVPLTSLDAEVLRQYALVSRDEFADSTATIESIQALNVYAATVITLIESTGLPDIKSIDLPDLPVVVAVYEALQDGWADNIDDTLARNNFIQTATTINYVAT